MKRKPRKPPAEPSGPKPQALHGKQPANANKHVAEQRRKILRTHYASKYRGR